jgi:RimJ/RimL family protein N-acetyltransferase
MWKVILKDGRKLALRFLTVNDKERLFQMFSSMSDEALEWSAAPYTMEGIERWTKNLSSMIALVAEFHGKIVGWASIYKPPQSRKKGIGDLAIYLHQDFHDAGLGTAMTKQLLRLARNEEMHRIELTVVKENKIALRLYEKFGFQIEGVSKDAFYGQDGRYHDIVNMGLILKKQYAHSTAFRE